jgi:hypothetical protein
VIVPVIIPIVPVIVPIARLLVLHFGDVLAAPVQNNVHDVVGVVAAAFVGAVHHHVSDALHDGPLECSRPSIGDTRSFVELDVLDRRPAAAGLAVLSDNFFTCTDAKLRKIKSLMTIVGGKVVHQGDFPDYAGIDEQFHYTGT